ncbi:MAG: ferredoxin [Gammaproteobacteria bacterium]|jgi:ferredoxin
MSETSALQQIALGAADRDGAARAQAMARVQQIAVTPTSLVGYNSNGRLLIAGSAAAARAAAARFAGTDIVVSLLITDGVAQVESQSTAGDAHYQVITAKLAAVRGYLGAFEVDVQSADGPRPLAPSILTANRLYDLVLDLGSPAVLSAQVPAPGYFAPGDDAQRLDAAIEAIPQLHGEFEKPRYFHYNPDICAHGERGQAGCNRCLLACPTEAIISLGERIEVNAHLCQGGGTCATACPTGAITYAFPQPAELTDRLRALLSTYRTAGGQTPVVLMHDGEAGHQWLLAEASSLPGHVLPFAVEEIGSAGLESWLSLLAFGATRLVILASEQTPPRVRDEIVAQIQILSAIAGALGHSSDVVQLVDAAPLEGLLDVFDAAGTALVDEAAVFAGVADKRAALRLALDYLYVHAKASPSEVALPKHAPFGHINVDASSCTLCMACASVCPAGAVITAGDSPRLDFIEQNCVQCGLCERACPENSISLQARLLFDTEQRAARRVLNEDQPFPCTSCGKVFGSTRTIERMLEKLSGHWMFQQNPQQMARLRMCEDCRVKDMFRDGGGLLDVDPGPRH